MVKNPIIVIAGPTASGKTKLAAHLANLINAEIISADSRQVFIDMNIGTGKDLSEYRINNNLIKSHLLDIKKIGEDFSVCEFQQETKKILKNLNDNKYAIICGGTTFYIKALIKNYKYTQIPPNKILRNHLESKDIHALLDIFNKNKSSYNTIADVSTKRRLIRAIEIAQFLNSNNNINITEKNNALSFKVFAIHVEASIRRKLILQRLNDRLNNGLIDEINYLLNNYPNEIIINYGLEYKYISLYLLGKLNYEEMKDQLFTQICRYSKRQMTFLRHVQKIGIEIKWIPYEHSLDKKLAFITNLL